MLTLPNYQINTQIYESTNSLIYRGIRKKDKQPVILKILKEDYPTPEELTRYRQEYEITKSFNLEGVIKTSHIEKVQKTLVIILEDFGGESLKILLNLGSETLPPPFEKGKLGKMLFSDFLPLAIQITESLGQIHAANVIHKDINPSNLVLNQDTNQLKIIDFGISTRLPRENPILKNPEKLEGTLAYISPEQTGRMNRALDYRSDLYSLGITFYELLTGTLPFESNDPLELVHCHIAKIPVPVSQVNSDVPQIISDILMKLMAKNAEDRYQSAFGVKADLYAFQLQFAKTSQVQSFPLAQNDFSGKLQISQKLYGRESEKAELLTAFERVRKGNVEMMLVAGYSGIGKSVLVKEIYQSLTKTQGYFISGKFDQLQRNIPYSAVVNACQQLVQFVLTEKEEQLSLWKEKILTALEPNGQVIIDVIPEIECIIGKQPPVPQLGTTDSQDNIFNMVFQNFLRVFCQPEHPLVIFLDDLQWVDSATLKLLEGILTVQDNSTLFLLGAYRDNEVDPAHPLIMTLDKLREEKVLISQITLKPLAFEDINQLIAESLHHNLKTVGSLTDLVMHKTGGNPFFVNQFLQTLYEENVLHFISPTVEQQGHWEWDIVQIKNLNITDNVVELMIGKLKKLPQFARQVLRLAACVGNHFDLETLSVIYEKSTNQTFQDIMPVLTEGLILPSSSLEMNGEDIQTSSLAIRHFRFLHDRVQQAAYALIDNQQKQAVHLQIGRLLLKNTSTAGLDEKVFEIVGQFNDSLALLTNPVERLKVAKLNLIAGQRAKMATAYGAALNYLTKGRACLPQNSWETEYDLTINLFIEATEAAYLIGDFEQMEELAQLVLQQVQTLSDESKICEIQIHAYCAQYQTRKAIKIALIFLNKLGIPLPEEPTAEQVGLALQERQVYLSGKTIHSFIDLPMMTDTNKILAMRIMGAIIPPTHQVLPTLLILVVLKQVELSLTFGNDSESAYAYVCYGLSLCGIVFDIESGYQFGKLALELSKRLNEKGITVRTVFVFNNLVRHWKEHVRETLQPLLGTYQLALDIGNIEFAAYSIFIYVLYSYSMGKPLFSLKSEMAQYSQAMTRLKQENVVSWYHLLWQSILNLMGHSDNPGHLSGEVYDENIQLALHQKMNDNTAIYCLYFNKCILHYLFQEYALAIENADKAKEYSDSLTSSLLLAIFPFYDSLARLGLYPSLSQQEQDAVLTNVSDNQKKMEEWAHHAPMNYQHKFYLVEAERARVLGKEGDAREFYDKAIALAHQNEYIHEEALAYELAGQFYWVKAMHKVAEVYLHDAYYAYQQWGALAKVKDLETRYPQLMKPKTATVIATNATISMPSSSVNDSSQWLDLNSIMKAAQTLSGEIVLSRLLEKMMHIVIENAAAEKGFLLLPQNDKWFIEAEGQIDNDEIKVLQSIYFENQSIAQTIIHYVERTQENVVLNNASVEGQFTRDAYIMKQRPKSLLCTPLVNQGQLTGILYLENNLTTGAFTSEHLEVLKVLSSQLAISIENALLYRTLEEKVEERTTQLADANEEIMFLNEQLKEENLRMGAELNVSRQLQQMLLPKEQELKQIETLDIAGFMEPAEEVGGDYYDVLQHNGRILFSIGDVTGHGLESGALAIMVQSSIRSLLANNETDPVRLFSALNQMVFHNVQRMKAGKSLTLVLLDYQENQFYLSGQHEEIIVVRDGELELIDTFDLGFSIGLDEEIAQFVNQIKVPLNIGDVVVLYTDGITEAENIDGLWYGLESLCQIIQENWEKTANEIQKAVIDDVRQFIGEQKVYDDITLLVLKQR